MFQEVIRASEKVATRISESRRNFLLRLGQGVLAATSALAGVCLGGAFGVSEPVVVGGPLGACFYSQNGQQYCQQLTQTQCALLPGSSWYQGLPCPTSPHSA